MDDREVMTPDEARQIFDDRGIGCGNRALHVAREYHRRMVEREKREPHTVGCIMCQTVLYKGPREGLPQALLDLHAKAKDCPPQPKPKPEECPCIRHSCCSNGPAWCICCNYQHTDTHPRVACLKCGRQPEKPKMSDAERIEKALASLEGEIVAVGGAIKILRGEAD